MSYDRTTQDGFQYNVEVVLCQDKRRCIRIARIIDGTAKNLVGEQVRALRIQRGMSQQALSDKLETMAIYVCRGSVSRIEDRQRTVTDIERYGLPGVGGGPIPQLFGPEEK